MNYTLFYSINLIYNVIIIIRDIYMNKNYDKAIFTNTKNRYISIKIYRVFKANFNDSYFLDEYRVNVNTMKDEIVWFDPFMGHSKINNVSAAIYSCSDDEITILEKRNNDIKEFKTEILLEHIICEDYDNSTMLASHIELSI